MMQRFIKKYYLVQVFTMIWIGHTSGQETGTWREMKVPTNIKYSTIDFADSAKGCLFTQQGVFVTTSDGGANWSRPETLQNCTQLLKVKYLTRDTLIAVDQIDLSVYLTHIPIKLHISTNSGVDWKEKILPDSLGPPGAATISLLNEKVIGFVNPRAILYRSTDLGSSWDTLQLHPLSIVAFLHIFQPNNYIIGGGLGLVGSGSVSQSTDSGKTWTRLYSGTSIESEYYNRSLGYFQVWSDDGNITTVNTILYNPSNESKLIFMNAAGYGALYDNGKYIAIANSSTIVKNVSDSTYYIGGWLPGDQRIRQFTTTDSRHAWILTDSNRVFQRTDLLTDVPRVKSLSSPMEFFLEQNYPNPFNPRTTIHYTIPSNDFVTLRVFDVLGNTVATLIDGNQPAGAHSIQFNASHLASGIYFYRLSIGNFSRTRKLVVTK
jgi:hypothetical protein